MLIFFPGFLPDPDPDPDPAEDCLLFRSCGCCFFTIKPGSAELALLFR